jgi:hypothetical protein
MLCVRRRAGLNVSLSASLIGCAGCRIAIIGVFTF